MLGQNDVRDLDISLWHIKGKGHPATGRGGPRDSGYIKAPDFRDFRYYKGGRSSAKRTGRLYLRRNPWY